MQIDRGTNGRMRRLPTLDLESYNDFLSAMRAWVFRDLGSRATERAQILTQRAGTAGGTPSFPEARAMFEADPKIALSQRMWISAQLMAHRNLLEGFADQGEMLEQRFQAAERSNCGVLELDPDIVLPDYVRHEFHIQPGGYVGDTLAGAVYHYGTNSFYMGANDQDGLHLTRARELTLPLDGRLDRAIDLGSGAGQFATVLQEIFPDAEIWGVDSAAPMLRYAHARAVELGVPVRFAQRLAEDTRFPDGHFDVATANILFHEVSPEGAAAIVEEMWRILRPGGVVNVIDFRMDAEFTPYFKYKLWADYHYNNECWVAGYYDHPFTDMMERRGFDLSFEEPKVTRGMLKKYIARKPG